MVLQHACLCVGACFSFCILFTVFSFWQVEIHVGWKAPPIRVSPMPSAFPMLCFGVLLREGLSPEAAFLHVLWKHVSPEPTFLCRGGCRRFSTEPLTCGAALALRSHIKGHRLFPFREQNSFMTRKEQETMQPAASLGKTQVALSTTDDPLLQSPSTVEIEAQKGSSMFQQKHAERAIGAGVVKRQARLLRGVAHRVLQFLVQVPAPPFLSLLPGKATGLLLPSCGRPRCSF